MTEAPSRSRVGGALFKYFSGESPPGAASLRRTEVGETPVGGRLAITGTGWRHLLQGFCVSSNLRVIREKLNLSRMRRWASTRCSLCDSPGGDIFLHTDQQSSTVKYVIESPSVQRLPSLADEELSRPKILASTCSKSLWLKKEKVPFESPEGNVLGAGFDRGIEIKGFALIVKVRFLLLSVHSRSCVKFSRMVFLCVEVL